MSEAAGWAAASALVRALDRALGPETVRAALLVERVALRWFDPSLGRALTKAQAARSGEVSGARLGRLPNVAVLENHVARALERALTPLLVRSGRVVVRAPRADAIDLESLCLFGALLEREARDALLIVVPDAPTHVTLCASRRRAELARIAAFGAHLEVLRDASIPSGEVEFATPSLSVAEETARAFASHAWSVALPWAERLVGEGEDGVDASMMAGISAHNVDPHDATCAARSEGHFGRVLEKAEDDADACHALYRLSLVAWRAHRDPGRALALAEEATVRGARIRDGRRAYFTAWALNARAFAQHRLGRADEAVASCREAIGLLRGAMDAPGIPPREVEDTLAHLEANEMRAAGART